METSYFSLSKKVSIGVSVGVALLLMVFIAYISLHWFIKIKNQQTSNPTSSALEVFHGKISYAYLRNATDGFSSSNLIGSGGFGTVFKAFLPIENKVVAVKVLNLHRRGAMKSFLTECESLKDESLFNQLSSASVRGTIGYAAPEYGMGGQPSIYGHVFGVLVLEMFTGKRPTNELFGGSVTLHNYTKLALLGRVLDIADTSILNSSLSVGFPLGECLTVVLEVGLKCCEESPKNRLATSEARKDLILIRERGSGDAETQLVPHDSSDDDWEALADREPSTLLSVEELPQMSKLSVEERKEEGPKRRGRGTFTYKKDVVIVRVIITSGSSPTPAKPNAGLNKTQNFALQLQRFSSCTRQNVSKDKTKVSNRKEKKIGEGKPAGQVQAVKIQNRYALLQDEGAQS
ncbi:unnamed protein product [Brassica oleracea]